jgi:hypothetical protein
MKLLRKKKWQYGIAACTLATLALADPNVHMHRSRAGSFTVNTWVLAESTEGRFSVQMPAPFDDFTQKSRRSGEDNRAYFLEASTPEKIRLSAMRGEFPDAAVASGNCLRMREGPVFGNDLKNRRNFEVAGRAVTELTVNDGRAWMVMRVQCFGREMLSMSVAAPLDKIAPAKELAGKFFDSLKLQTD